ncbi:tigger transposable element-derived protein 6-like [Rhizophagus clarus]|uniref:Tigger transposable element-derived protein 6-like n=1 Tax=Rhizophagus clarus TaxID=94130 RepID=A0A8H3L2A9_9GLOM|nr:tigger transposable element-derived protein 6-like [Rhizophagus clarus]
MLLKRKRVSLSAKQKRKICEMKEKDLALQNVELAQKYNVGKSTITNILKENDHALGLWVDNVLNTKQSIDSGFKKQHGLRQFKKQGEVESDPSAELIERDRLILQQLLALYNLKDIWNDDKTGLFWKMKLSRVLARNSLSVHKKEKSCITIFCVINATDETQEKLDSIDVKFLPPNTTTKLQPCDAGIIHSFNIVKELADYTIYNALQNAAEAWSMVSPQTILNCWKKMASINEIGKIPDDDSVFSDDSDLSVYEYLHIEDEMLEGRLTDFEMVDTIQNANKEEEDMSDKIEFMPTLEKVSLTDAEKAIDKTMKFLYEQEPEFGDVNEELKVLRKLHKKVKVLVVKNLRQVDLITFNMINSQ